jgi:hypothetical protein
MRIILQDRKSQLYLSSGGAWADSRDDAELFEHISEAAGFALAAKLVNVDVLLNFGDPKHDIRIPTSEWNQPVGLQSFSRDAKTAEESLA